jgi:hypothetical protein
MPANTEAFRLPVRAMSPPPTNVKVSSGAGACDRVLEARASVVFDGESPRARPIAIAAPPTRHRGRAVHRTRTESRIAWIESYAARARTPAGRLYTRAGAP